MFRTSVREHLFACNKNIISIIKSIGDCVIDFKFKNTVISLYFSFFALFAVLFYSSGSMKILLALVACLVHEAGHIALMSLYKCTPRRIIFYGGGIKIIPNCRIISFNQELFVLVAGSAVNIILGVVLARLGAFNDFASANLVLGIFNLLPFKAFDGGRILKLVFEADEYSRYKRFYDFTVKIICVGILVCGFYCVFQFEMNLSLLVTVCYIVLSEFFC